MLPFTQGDSWPQPPPMAKKYSSRWFLRTFTLSKWFILSTVLLHVCMCAQTLSRVQLFLHVTPLPWDPPIKNTEVGCYFLLQGIFPAHGSNPYLLHLLHWQVSVFFNTTSSTWEVALYTHASEQEVGMNI